MPERLRAILWCAVSSRPQAGDDKESLPAQERDLRTLAEREGWNIVDVLVVPGHSRKFYNWLEFAQAAREVGMDAPHQMLVHWKAADFDVFACRDGSRFGREQSIFGEVVARTIDQGARIYTLSDGWIDATNYRMFISMVGYHAAAEVSGLMKRTAATKDKLAARGLPTGSHIPISHLRRRDPLTGRDIGLEIDESKRRLWDDLATLVLEGIGWNKLPIELYNRFGHVDGTGRVFRGNQFYDLLHNPLVWGHSARRHTQPFKYGAWCFDASAPPPDGVQVTRNVLPPLYTGEMAARLKAELRRRMEIRGHARSSDTYRFSRLVLCDECGRLLSTAVRHGKRRGLRCVTAHHKDTYESRYKVSCNQNKVTVSEVLQGYLHKLLERRLRGEPFDDGVPEPAHTANHSAALQADIVTVEQQLETLIHEQSLASASVQNYYRQQVQSLAERLDILKATLARTEQQQRATETQLADETASLDAIRAIGLERFWQLPDREINQLLHRVLGNRRLVVRDQKIIGVITI